MSNLTAAVLTLAGVLLLFTDAPERVRRLYDGTVLTGQQLATAGDLRSLSTMLDHHLLRTGRCPRPERFEQWLAATFKSGSGRDLALDHWGTPFSYRAGAELKSYELISAGPDLQFGTGDDLLVDGP
ncbi:type II secretion system protein GspG [Desulfofustis glycolicus]|uniref:General secretion pathway protein G n=1 Tax=Desulfofustis glycolicus DSM 9705 TaxID=1121409 RepID=A0A1M5YMK9_9BACT|nr:type II secretion system protein GspG [Desulfofustis glycolicus]SHI13242.1 general secretion pathway protein G [Desulfofustis glycolicus DSM 9705]